MQRVIFIRHSQTRPQPNIPSHLWPLTAEGQRRCIPLAKQLKQHAPQWIYTSTEAKASETGRLIGEQLGIPVFTAEGLHEHDRRSNAPYIQSETAFKKMIAKVLTQPDDVIYGRESGAAARLRFEKSVDKLATKHSNETLAIVSHGTVLTLYLAPRLKLDPVHFWTQLGQPAFISLQYPSFELVELVYKVLADG